VTSDNLQGCCVFLHKKGTPISRDLIALIAKGAIHQSIYFFFDIKPNLTGGFIFFPHWDTCYLIYQSCNAAFPALYEFMFFVPGKN